MAFLSVLGLSLGLALGIPFPAAAATASEIELPSQMRQPDQSEEEAFRSYAESRIRLGEPIREGSAYSDAVPLTQPDLSQVPKLDSYAAVEQEFRDARDLRYLTLPENPAFLRLGAAFGRGDVPFGSTAFSARRVGSVD